MTGAFEGAGVVLLAVAAGGWVAQSDDAVLWLAAVVGGLVIIFTAGRKAAHLLRKASHALDDWTGEEARPGVPARKGIAERTELVEQLLVELKGRTDEALQLGWANTEQLQLANQQLREHGAQLRALKLQLERSNEERAAILRGVMRDREAFVQTTGVELPPPDPSWADLTTEGPPPGHHS